MRKLVLFMHLSLDGRATNAHNGIEWIKVSDEMFERSEKQSAKSDLALYGHGTYQIMEAYWPTAADKPNATKHDINHAKWYKQVNKVIASNTLPASDDPKLTVIGHDVPGYISQLKQQPGGDIVMFGSPTLARSLMRDNLIDDYWLFINPIILGAGKPLFGDLKHDINLKLVESDTLTNGVVCMHYTKA